jgi:hypothetical protein
MPADLKASIFQDQLNTTFDVAGAACSLTLTQIVIHSQTARHEAFSLFFHGPAAPFLGQGIQKLNHATLGELDIFLVPVAREQDGYQYEAVFNQIL